MADKNEYVSARMYSKARLEMNKTIMVKAHEEGGDLTSSEPLACAFLLLAIAEMSGDVAEIEQIIESDTAEFATNKSRDNESEPLIYKAALRSPQASE